MVATGNDTPAIHSQLCDSIDRQHIGTSENNQEGHSRRRHHARKLEQSTWDSPASQMKLNQVNLLALL